MIYDSLGGSIDQLTRLLWSLLLLLLFTGIFNVYCCLLC